MLELRINPLVVTDLREIRNFIAEDNPQKAEEIINEIYSKFENVQIFPNIGTDLSKRVRFRTDYKYVVWKDYIIIYKFNSEFAEIYRVINRYQDITRIFE